MSRTVDLPNDVEALKSLVLARSSALEAAEALVISQKLELEKLRFQIACLKRARFGRSSEQLDQQRSQMQLTLEDLEASLATIPERRGLRRRRRRKSLRVSHCQSICRARRSCMQPRAAARPVAVRCGRWAKMSAR